MGAGRRSIDAENIVGAGMLNGELHFYTTVTAGLANAVDRKVHVHCDRQSTQLLLRVIAERDPEMILRVAEAIRKVDRIAEHSTGMNAVLYGRGTSGSQRSRLIQAAMTRETEGGK